MEKEVVVATIAPEVIEEQELKSSVIAVENDVTSVTVTNDEEYAQAGELGIALRSKIADVQKFFAPMKKSAHDAHKQICDREKEMLDPLKQAEKILKNTMSDYAMEKERIRREQEEALRKLAAQAVEDKLEEAIQGEASGDEEAVKAAMLDAEIMDKNAANIVVESADLKQKGVSTRTDYEIESIDLSKVPTDISGICIRPVDEAAVMKLIKMSKGTIKIDGIKFKEVKKTVFRRG